MLRLPLLTGILVSLLATGCSTTRSRFDDLAGRFSRPNSESDALLLDKETLSEGFQKSLGGFSSKGLKKPETTNLVFARWKEDVGRYAESKHRYQEILTENPDCLPARLGIARIERETGRFDQCREILNTARKRHPNDPTIMLELGRMYNEREQWDESVRAFARAVDLAPDDQQVRYELGLALANAGRVSDALPHLKFAVGDSAAFYNIGYVLHEHGCSTDAVNWVKRALNEHPDGRTRQVAGELLAELERDLVNDPAYSETDSALATSQRTLSPRPEIRAASAGSDLANQFHTAEWTRTPTQPSKTTRTYPAPPLSGTLVRPATDITKQRPAPTGPTAPPQWTGRQDSQSNWTKSTRSQIPVQATGYGQPVAVPQFTDPPVWRPR